MIADRESNLINWKWISGRQNQKIEEKIIISLSPSTYSLKICVINQEWANVDKQIIFDVRSNTTQLMPFAIDLDDTTTKNVSKTNSRSGKTCAHRCKDKSKCRHSCCKVGLPTTIPEEDDDFEFDLSKSPTPPPKPNPKVEVRASPKEERPVKKARIEHKEVEIPPSPYKIIQQNKAKPISEIQRPQTSALKLPMSKMKTSNTSKPLIKGLSFGKNKLTSNSLNLNNLNSSRLEQKVTTTPIRTKLLNNSPIIQRTVKVDQISSRNPIILPSIDDF
ncbi:hypothetical protein GEMRC1_004064 [Eukaryota sp. GEM-RC1]